MTDGLYEQVTKDIVALEERIAALEARLDDLERLADRVDELDARTDIMQLVAFECQRCGTITRIQQESGKLQEPHECCGCERQGPFQINHDQSAWTDIQLVRLQLPPERSQGQSTAQIDVYLRDDVVDVADAGDRVTVSGAAS